MRYIILFSGLLFATFGFANTLHDYNDITSALISGKSLHIVTDFAQCNASNKLGSEIRSIAIFTPNEIGITNDHIVTALTHFTVNDPYFPGKPVYEFARYTITPDNNMNVSLQVFDAATYALLKDKVSFNCKVGQSTKIYI